MDKDCAIEKLLALVAVALQAGLEVFSIVEGGHSGCQANRVFSKLHPPLRETSRDFGRGHCITDTRTGESKNLGKGPHNNEPLVIYGALDKRGVKRPSGAHIMMVSLIHDDGDVRRKLEQKFFQAMTWCEAARWIIRITD